MTRGAMKNPIADPGRGGYLSTVAVVAAFVLLGLLLSRLGLPDPWNHAALHAVFGGAALALFALIRSRWPAPLPHPAARPVRMVLMVGLAVLSLGQGLEGAGAFGFRGDAEFIPGLAQMHDIGLIIGTVGLLLAMLGGLLTVVVSVAARYDMLNSRWLKVGMAMAVASVVLFVIGGFIFGY